MPRRLQPPRRRPCVVAGVRLVPAAGGYRTEDGAHTVTRDEKGSGLWVLDGRFLVVYGSLRGAVEAIRVGLTEVAP